ncbi:uncharacterized protein [Ptychodera flava]|uniref:uncharacterized protein n=1 Tax=Ptychodera flava TaxID=63121 RepID=UPI00396A7192
MYREFGKVLQSDKYKQSVAILFKVPVPSSQHFRTAFCVVRHIRAKIIENAVQDTKEKSKKADHTEKKTFKGSVAGRGKIRYIGGWCLATLRYRKKQNVLQKLYKKKHEKEVERLDMQVKYLEHLVATEDSLQSSAEKETLLETKRKQNVRGGLVNITDSAFHFFEKLDTIVRKEENMNNVAVHGPNLYEFITQEAKNDELL